MAKAMIKPSPRIDNNKKKSKAISFQKDAGFDFSIVLQYLSDSV